MLQPDQQLDNLNGNQSNQSYYIAKNRVASSLQSGLNDLARHLPDAWLIPANKDKQPAHAGSQQYYTLPSQLRDELSRGSVIRECGENRQEKNIYQYVTGYKLLTGKPVTYQDSRFILIALDVDGIEAQKTLDKLLGGRSLPDTVSWSSGKQGRCTCLFKIPAGEIDLVSKATLGIKSGNVAIVNGGKLEVIAGWPGVMMPPSKHPETDGYKFLEGHSFNDVAIADLPDYLLKFVVKQPTYTKLDDIPLPVPESFPLVLGCRREVRDLIEIGVPEGSGHNDQALSVAKELVSVERYLQYLGQSFTDDAESLYQQFVAASGIEYDAKCHGRLADAQGKTNLRPSCGEERVDNCIKGWYWREILKRDSSAIASNGKQEISEQDRLKLAIQLYSKESDPFKRVILQKELYNKHRLSDQKIKELCQYLESQSSTPQKTVFSFAEFMESGSEALEWLIPNFLPKAETLILAAKPKCGKTLLSTDIIYGVISGTNVLGEKTSKGKVLLISSDESANSTRRRLKARGFDLLPEASNLRVMTHLDLNDLSPLECQLEDFKPDLVVIDSLTSISRDIGLSEKDAEFAKPIYRLKDLLGRYGAAGLLIHHENKSKEAAGIDKISGSARIVAAVWGIWQLVAANPGDEQDPKRWLKIKPREGESNTHILEINPRDTWISNGIFSYIGEFGDEDGQKKTQAQRVIELLTSYSPRGLTYREIDDFLNIGKSLYTVLDRLEGRIEKRRSLTDPKQWVYAIPSTDNCTTQDNEVKIPGEEEFNNDDTPPPHISTFLLNNFCNPDAVSISTSSTTIQQPFNNHSTGIQQSFNNGLTDDPVLNTSNPDIVSDSTGIQQTDSTRGKKGGGVYVESVEQESDQSVLTSPAGFNNDQPVYDWNDLERRNNDQIVKLGWSQQDAKDYLLKNYKVKSRHRLSDEQMLDFITQLDLLINQKVMY